MSRRAFIRLLDERFRKDTDAALATGLNRALISQCRNGLKPIGDRLANSIEKIFGLPYRALDYPNMQPHKMEAAAAAPLPASDDIAELIQQLPDGVRIPIEMMIRSLVAQERKNSAPQAVVPPFHLSVSHEQVRQKAVGG